MNVGPPMVRALRTAFIDGTGYDMSTVATYLHSG